METLAHVLAFLLLAWLAALAATVIGKTFIGTESARGLLQTRRDDGAGGAADPERVQLLVVSLGAIGLYALDAIRAAAAGPVTSLPDAVTLSIVLTGSNTVYLSGKLFRTR
jgi:hypothetical protein